MLYSHFLFAQVVTNELLIPNNLNVPYAYLHDVVMVHYDRFKVKDTDKNVPEQDAVEHYVTTSESLLKELEGYHNEYSGEHTHTCPHCSSKFNYNDKQSGYQVNDNDEQVYCSYECSAVATLHHLQEEYINTGTEIDLEELSEVIEGT